MPQRTSVVLLGTGTPRPDPACSGPATAILAGDAVYLVDFGPGIVRRAEEARLRVAPALVTTKLTKAFVTHLHSDHTAGYADLILTPWVVGRTAPLDVFGPVGISSMTRNLLDAYAEDIRVRVNGIEALHASGVQVRAHEIQPGIVWQDANVTVTAFRVSHGDWTNAFGYRFECADRTIVLSGDTSPHLGMKDAYRDCDALIHEVYTEASFAAISPKWQEYRLKYHTSTRQLAEIARDVRPRLLILSHRENPGGTEMPSEEDYLDEISQYYDGTVVVGKDLDVY